MSWWYNLILKSIQVAKSWAAKIGSQSVRMYVAEWSWPQCLKSWTFELTVSGASVNLLTVAAASPALIFLLSKSTAQQPGQLHFSTFSMFFYCSFSHSRNYKASAFHPLSGMNKFVSLLINSEDIYAGLVYFSFFHVGKTFTHFKYC